MPLFRLLAALLIITPALQAQKKISVDLNFNLFIPSGKFQDKTYYSPFSPTTVDYFSQRKFKNPYFSLIPNISYAISSRIQIGLQTGVYVHYLERYLFLLRNTVAVPLQITSRYTIWTAGTNSVGISIAAGMIFLKIHEYYRYKNSFTLNGSLFYANEKGSIVKIGLEQQYDRRFLDLTDEYFGNETFKFLLKRFSFSVSYGVMI